MYQKFPYRVYLVFCIYYIQQIIYSIRYAAFPSTLRTTPTRRTTITTYRDPSPSLIVFVLVYTLHFWFVFFRLALELFLFTSFLAPRFAVCKLPPSPCPCH
jgi:hypothetical protein